MAKIALLRALWAPQQPAQDVDRWLQQGFVFQPAGAAFPLGLVQGHGGPCGVLAAVQAELLRLFFFPERVQRTPDERGALLEAPIDEASQRQWLVRALASLLVQCSGGQSTVRVVSEKQPADPATTFADSVFDETAVENVASPADAALLGVLTELLPALQAPRGVVLFMLSVLRTKGLAALRDDMDDPESPLTGQFGHCGQELLNLLLTGVASSNVFDGAVPMGDTGLMLRGVHRRPRLGYLTQLEALRYCQVGNYFKSPQFPVWVVGSSSHFSVCFALDLRLCEASASAMLFQRMQRVFKAFDPMEAGFMEMGSLADSLRQLGVASDVVGSDYWMAQLCARLEVSGAGIILWDEYWRVVSVLVHTGDVELALSGNYSSEGSRASRPKTDEEIARELQAQFDNEGGASSGAAAAPAAQAVDPPAEAAHQQFELYYYNGLIRSTHGQEQAVYPEVEKAAVTVDGAQEFIGASIPIELTTSTGSGGYAGPPLEEILKTKWPSAKFAWSGSDAPSVD